MIMPNMSVEPEMSPLPATMDEGGDSRDLPLLNIPAHDVVQALKAFGRQTVSEALLHPLIVYTNRPLQVDR